MAVWAPLKLFPQVLFASLFSYVFITSGMIVSIFSLLLLFIWPIAGATYRKITSGLSYTVLGQIVWLCTDYGNLRIHIFGDEETYKRFGREFHIVTSSHRGDLDWVAGFVLGGYYKFLHSIRSLPKKSMLYFPGFGQLLWALEYPYLQRNNYEKDKLTIQRIAKVYKNYPFPIQVAIYCEGTRFTKKKYEQSLEYAQKNGLPLLKHHLTPRTKGFALLVENLRGNNFKAVYDVAVAYPKWAHNRVPNHLDILLRERVDIYWYMRRIPMEDLPETHEELNMFCHKMYQFKDEAYEHFLQKGEFPAPRQKLPPFGNTRWKLRAIMAAWGFLLTLLPLSIMSVLFTPITVILVVGTLVFLNMALFCVLLIYGKGKGVSAPR